MESAAQDAVFVFSSSVSTYGDTTAEAPPIRPDHPQTALDLYAESKIAGEQRIRDASVDAVILRIAGITVPELREPPEVWPFTADQRLEMVHRDDVVMALYKALLTPEARGQTLNIAGGLTWQTTGRQYVADLYDILGVPIDMASFRSEDEPGWVDWYDTEASQRLLNYQTHSYPSYLDAMRQEVEKLLEE
ncbi:MAG: NAD(P)-dependent oxidoreductase, partial [Candidatus Tectomicrobia bacterium]